MAVQIEQEISVKPHVITLEEYERMCEAGVFEPEARIELIRGEIVDMSPIGHEHQASVTRLILFLIEQLARRALVWPQGNDIRLPDSNSRPQPDVTVLRWRDDFYRSKGPTAEDVILLIEVSESSLKYDRGSKLQLYAEAGVAEYWVVNLVDRVIEVYTDLSESEYKTVKIIKRNDTLQLPAGLGSGSTLTGADLLG